MISDVALPTLHRTSYGWFMLIGIIVSLTVWVRLVRRDDRLVMIYVAALAGAFFGAKLVYLGAEGWMHWHDPNRWIILATGKSITGALLGGYIAVELAKRVFQYAGTTGDWFAVIVPAGVMFGRIGCMLNGCCLGRVCDRSWYTINDFAGTPRWPASELEFAFNALMFGVALILRRLNLLPGQHFHVYLMAYGTFRFFHEFLRDTPALLGPISGYQLAALAMFILGATGFVRRRSVQRFSTVVS